MDIDKIFSNISDFQKTVNATVDSLCLIKEKGGVTFLINKNLIKCIIPHSDDEVKSVIKIAEDSILVDLTVSEIYEQIKKATS